MAWSEPPSNIRIPSAGADLDNQRRSNILPIVMEGWQIGCCGEDHEAVVGQLWACPVILYATEVQPSEEVAPIWTNLENHQVAARGYVHPSEHASSGGHSLLELGPCLIGLGAVVDGSCVTAEGMIIAEWHGGWQRHELDADPTEILLEGRVHRLRTFCQIRIPDPADRLIPLPTGRFEVIDVESSSEGGRNLGPPGWAGHVLVDLDVAPEG
jgi:hypothetical protein